MVEYPSTNVMIDKETTSFLGAHHFWTKPRLSEAFDRRFMVVVVLKLMVTVD